MQTQYWIVLKLFLNYSQATNPEPGSAPYYSQISFRRDNRLETCPHQDSLRNSEGQTNRRPVGVAKCDDVEVKRLFQNNSSRARSR